MNIKRDEGEKERLVPNIPSKIDIVYRVSSTSSLLLNDRDRSQKSFVIVGTLFYLSLVGSMFFSNLQSKK